METWRSATNARGFSLVELITILVLVGILAVVVVPRLTDMGVFKEKGYAGEVAAAFRHARQLAVAGGAPVRVTLATASGIEVRFDSGAAVAHPVRGGSYAVPNPDGISLSGAVVVFDALGRALDTGGAPADREIRVAGRKVLDVIGETGCLVTP
ncbi:MAG: hypothetical protein JXB25_02985 [Deltaproteobacteria bacterium]|nr:hypothetical protein [Deltaproteobacteria bacterium]